MVNVSTRMIPAMSPSFPSAFVPTRVGSCLTLAASLLVATLPTYGQQIPSRALPGDPEVVTVGNGIRLHYVDRGRGEPLVFVHGTLQDYTGWLPHVEAFAERYRVIAYSRRLNWPNTNPALSGDYSARLEARDLAGLIEALDLGRVHLVGLSYGALTSLFLTIERPDLVRTAVLTEPPMNGADIGAPSHPVLRGFDEVARLIDAGRSRAAAERFFVGALGAERTRQIPEAAWQQVLLNLPELNALVRSSEPFPVVAPDDLRRIDRPALMILGEASVGGPYESYIDALVEQIPGAETATIPASTHLVWYEQGDTVREVVLGFLDRWDTHGPSNAPSGAEPDTEEPPALDRSDVDRPAADEAIAGIEAVADSFAAAVRDQDPERFACLFTSDATYVSNDGHLWENRDEVREAARDWMQVLQEPTSTTVATEVFGDVAYLLQRYSSVIHLPDGRRPTVAGYSLAVLKEQADGTWKIAALVVNRDPMPGGGTP